MLSSERYKLFVTRLTASCDIIFGDAMGIRDQFGVIGMMGIGSMLSSGLSRRDLLLLL